MVKQRAKVINPAHKRCFMETLFCMYTHNLRPEYIKHFKVASEKLKWSRPFETKNFFIRSQPSFLQLPGIFYCFFAIVDIACCRKCRNQDVIRMKNKNLPNKAEEVEVPCFPIACTICCK